MFTEKTLVMDMIKAAMSDPEEKTEYQLPEREITVNGCLGDDASNQDRYETDTPQWSLSLLNLAVSLALSPSLSVSLSLFLSLSLSLSLSFPLDFFSLSPTLFFLSLSFSLFLSLYISYFRSAN